MNKLTHKEALQMLLAHSQNLRAIIEDLNERSAAILGEQKQAA